MALYQLEFTRAAEHTVVDQAVHACALLERWSAKGYVNALLRRFLRERTAMERELERDPELHYQHPRWWVDLVRGAYPGRWEDVLAQGNRPPPMCLRINQRRASVAEYAARMAALGIATRELGAQALLLEQPLPVQRLPGYLEGEVSVQDAGAQRAARCLELANGHRVLDACAAPGGKAGHILESADVELTAVDIDPARAARIERNLQRLGLAARVEVADALQFAAAPGPAFDRILADVPCSGSGVAGRHPDIKWLRREGDVCGFALRQTALLEALWRRLAPGGKLLYVTCSVFSDENDAVLDAFVARTPQARRRPLPGGAAAQLLPCAENDGFFYGQLEKAA